MVPFASYESRGHSKPRLIFSGMKGPNVGSVCTALPKLLGPRTLITHGLQRLMVVSFPRCTVGPTPLPTQTQQLPTFLVQQCWELLRPLARSLQERKWFWDSEMNSRQSRDKHVKKYAVEGGVLYIFHDSLHILPVIDIARLIDDGFV